MLVKLIILTALCVAASNQFIIQNFNEIKSPDNFDFLVFRQIWPQSTCMFPGHHSCSIAKNITTWVVHGLWPSIIGSHDGPFFCNKSLPFNPRNIDWLLPKLEEYWPNLYTDTPLESFWEHEWTKHGTCALGLPDINNESGYFDRTLKLRDHFDFGPILKGSEIVPDDEKLYDLDNIKEAISKVLGVEPGLTCYVFKGSKKQYLSQMQICLNKDYEQIDCNQNSVDLLKIKSNTPQQTECQSGIPVHFPTIQYKPDFV